MRKIFLGVVYTALVWGQSAVDPTVIKMGASAPAGVTSVTAQIVGNAGNNSYYYWVVANFPIGQSQVSPSAQLINAPNLSGSNYVTILWNPVGATSYDILRTTTPFIFNPCTCAVATGQTGSSVNDTGGALSSYVYAPTSNATAKFELDNRNFSQPVIYGNTPYNSVMFANLPSASSSKGLTYLVVDASTNTTCTSGGGTNTPAICWSNGSSWLSIGASSTGGNPTGPAGGALSGSYPNPCAATITCGTVVPTANCTPGTTPDYLNTATATRYYCSATNTWSVGQSVVGNLSVQGTLGRSRWFICYHCGLTPEVKTSGTCVLLSPVITSMINATIGLTTLSGRSPHRLRRYELTLLAREQGDHNRSNHAWCKSSTTHLLTYSDVGLLMLDATPLLLRVRMY